MTGFKNSLFGTGEKGQIINGYKGIFSTYAECHSFIIGFYHSLSPKSEGIPKELSDKESPRYNHDVDKEPHMAKYGYVSAEYSKYVLFILVWLLQ